MLECFLFAVVVVVIIFVVAAGGCGGGGGGVETSFFAHVFIGVDLFSCPLKFLKVNFFWDSVWGCYFIFWLIGGGYVVPPSPLSHRFSHFLQLGLHSIATYISSLSSAARPH